MVYENKDVEQESSSALADAIASSPEAQEQLEQQSQGTEAGTPQQPVSQEQKQQPMDKIGFGDSRHPDHERFVELHQQNKWLKQQLERQMQSQQPIQQPMQDPYAGMTAEEEKFWRAVDVRAEKIAEQKVKQISPIIDAGRMELAQLKVQQFRATYPDIKPNSPEEIAIAEKIQMGYLPEDAYRSVMWDSKVANTEKQVNQSIKQKMEAKRQANVENRSMPSNTNLPTQEKLSLRQRIEKNWDKMERGEL